MTAQLFGSVMLLAVVHLAAMLSPGPTALIVLRHGAEPRMGPMAPLVSGIVGATVTNVALMMAGVAAVIAASPALGLALALGGAAYLVWLGIRNLMAAVTKMRHRRAARAAAAPVPPPPQRRSPAALFRDGYLVNLLNPKIAIFYVSIFSQVAAPDLPRAALAVFGGQLILQSALFWSCFAILARSGVIARAIDASNGWVDFVFGGALIGFATTLAWSAL
ncbi:LysE family translocator [Tistrella mobilis]|uniref:Amino acid transporter LysE n=1 Tax=Tistrella mobilis (strain KA081020-065) TaxID=1110502 RepID=I3TI64_TISMK|nr:LysE family transporter [Tistrella mobilis]AFK52452.1 amino acid transporter LysE [Tistrella mobilis KA081020-065]